MNKNIVTIGLIILLLIGSFFGGRYYERCSYQTDIKDTIQTVVEKIVVKNDSIFKVNDSINIKVIEIEKTYEKTIDDIIRNNPDDDYNFFSTYIERYCGRNNADSAQNSEFNIR